MTFVVFDLEWNNAGFENRVDEAVREALPFEIIEIGAVKYDENLNELGRFSELVRPTYYRKLTRFVKRVTERTQASLSRGDRFPLVARRFADFVGDGILCSWSPSDPFVLRQNTAFFETGWPGRWQSLDLQRYYALKVENGDIREQRSVAYALERLGLKNDDDLHTALGDAVAEGAILQAIGAGDLADFIVDLAPTKRYTAALQYDGETSEAADARLIAQASRCPVCDQKLTLDRSFRGRRQKRKRVAACPRHGLLRQTLLLFESRKKATLQQDFLFQGAAFLKTRPLNLPPDAGETDAGKSDAGDEPVPENGQP